MELDADLVGPFEATAGSSPDPGIAGPIEPNLFDRLDAPVSPAAFGLIDRSGPDARAFFDILMSAAPESGDRDQLLEGCLKVQEHERLRIGQELHDSTGQLLVSLQLSVAYLRHLDADRGHEAIFDEISDTLRRIDHEIRTIAYINYPAELASGGLTGALRSLARGFGQRTGLHVHFSSICSHPLDGGIGATAMLRVAQEALVNIYRHAKAGSVCIALVQRKNGLELTIDDDGRGIPRDKKGNLFEGVGLHGMRRRIECLGGRFSLPRLSHGTRVRAIVPLEHFEQALAA